MTNTEEKLRNAYKTFQDLWWDDPVYWYPLRPSNRENILAFDIVSLKEAFSNDQFCKFQTDFFCDDAVYVFPEVSDSHIECPLYPYDYDSEDVFIMDAGIKNIIYISWDGFNVTLGGDKIIGFFKTKFPQWSEHLYAKQL